VDPSFLCVKPDCTTRLGKICAFCETCLHRLGAFVSMHNLHPVNTIIPLFYHCFLPFLAHIFT
jgi:hypothetical protein